MLQDYEEIYEGESILRRFPDSRHEVILDRLTQEIASSMQENPALCLLERRSLVQLTAGTMVRPDLTLVTQAGSRPWLVVEVISALDHRADTVLKKEYYEQSKVPRLWMIDPRYDNVEVYHSSPYGMVLKKMLSNQEPLSEAGIKGFSVVPDALFGSSP